MTTHRTPRIVAILAGSLLAALAPGVALGAGAIVTHEPVVFEDCHPDTDPVTGETFLTCVSGEGTAHIVVTPSGLTILNQNVSTDTTVTGDMSGFVSHSVATSHQLALTRGDAEVPHVNHASSHTTTTTGEETCGFTTVFQFVDGEQRAFVITPTSCRPSG